MSDGATSSISRLPVQVEPVMATFATSGCVTSSSAIAINSLLSTEMTPAGMPPSISAAQNAVGDMGVTGVGLTTTVQPVASAGPSFQLSSETG